MDPAEIDWATLIQRALLQRLGRQPEPEELHRAVEELRAARNDPEGGEIGRQLRALGTGALGPEAVAFVERVLDLTLAQLEALGDAGQAAAPSGPDPALARALGDARLLLQPFLQPGADCAALTAALHPRPEDHALAFEPAWAGLARSAYERIFQDPRAVIAPKPGQTELLLAAATAEQLRSQAPPRTFPGGFAELGPALRPGAIWLCWKFVEPGRSLGMAFDGLCRIEGRFAWFPKAWRVIGRVDA